MIVIVTPDPVLDRTLTTLAMECILFDEVTRSRAVRLETLLRLSARNARNDRIEDAS